MRQCVERGFLRVFGFPHARCCVARGAEYALLFDCDGVIVDTEQLHRRAYCGAFEAFGLTIDGKPVVWDVRTNTNTRISLPARFHPHKATTRTDPGRRSNPRLHV